MTLIVICGLGLVAFSKYQYHQGILGTTTEPTTSETWFTAISFDICGTQMPNVPTNPNKATAGLNTQSDGLIHIHPRGKGESGNNATLGKFVSEYKGMALTASSVQYPGQAKKNNGEKCTGKASTVQVKVWNTTSDNTGHMFKGDASALKLNNGMEITIAFVPPGTNIPKPPTKVIENLLTAQAASAPTTTAAPGSAPSTPASTPASTPVSVGTSAGTPASPSVSTDAGTASTPASLPASGTPTSAG